MSSNAVATQAINAAIAAAAVQAGGLASMTQAQIEQAVEDAVTATATAAAAAAAAAAPAFSLLPGDVTSVIDYTTSEGCKYGKAAQASLSIKYDLKTENLPVFLGLVNDTGMKVGWHATLEVPTDLADAHNPDKLVNICTHFGAISIEQCIAWEKTYLKQPLRAAQDTANLYQCLIATLTADALKIIMQYESEYTVEGKKSGLVLLKVIIRESHIDTGFTERDIRHQLSVLDQYMVSVNSDVKAFNLHVNALQIQLAARKASTEDLLANLLKGYKAAKDTKFIRFVETLEDDIDGGKDIKTPELMRRCLTKYQIMKQRKEWQAPTAEDEKLIALEAKYQQLNALQSKLSDMQKDRQPGTPRNRQRNRDRKPWMDEDLKEGEDPVKTVDGKIYRYCKKHKWCAHLTKDCRSIKKEEDQQPPAQQPTDQTAPTPELQLQAAMQAIIDDEEDDE
jgi:hypothetical protein